MKKLEKTATAWALTAHRLSDGVVVYRDAQGGWAETVGEAEVFGAKEAADAAEAAAAADVAAQLVISPYLIEVAAGADVAAPVSVREQIRALGPTIRTDLGKQAESPQ